MTEYRYKKMIDGKEYESTLNVTNKFHTRPYEQMKWENGVPEMASQGLEEAGKKNLALDAIARKKEIEKRAESLSDTPKHLAPYFTMDEESAEICQNAAIGLERE